MRKERESFIPSLECVIKAFVFLPRWEQYIAYFFELHWNNHGKSSFAYTVVHQGVTSNHGYWQSGRENANLRSALINPR